MREKPFSLNIRVLLTLTVFFWVSGPHVRAFAESLSPAQCKECQSFDEEVKQKIAKKERTEDILNKNKEYLQKNPNASKSIVIKVKSNVMITLIQIETAQNEIVALKNKVETQRCTQCPSK